MKKPLQPVVFFQFVLVLLLFGLEVECTHFVHLEFSCIIQLLFLLILCFLVWDLTILLLALLPLLYCCLCRSLRQRSSLSWTATLITNLVPFIGEVIEAHVREEIHCLLWMPWIAHQNLTDLCMSCKGVRKDCTINMSLCQKLQVRIDLFHAGDMHHYH